MTTPFVDLVVVSILDFDFTCPEPEHEYTMEEVGKLHTWRDLYEPPILDPNVKFRKYNLRLDFKLHQSLKSLGCVVTRDEGYFEKAPVDKPFPVDLDMSKHPKGEFPVSANFSIRPTLTWAHPTPASSSVSMVMP